MTSLEDFSSAIDDWSFLSWMDSFLKDIAVWKMGKTNESLDF